MNKEQAAERLYAIESEVEKLRRIIDEPEARKPEAGDVWSSGDSDYLLFEDGYSLVGGPIYVRMKIGSSPWTRGNYTYLGKFDEVYVKISDVRDALSHKDACGDSLLECLELPNSSIGVFSEAANLSRDALCKLNIITD